MDKSLNLNHEVTVFLDTLNHPFRNEIELLRSYILAAQQDLTENIKWNGPNYCFDQEDRITMRVQPLKKQAQLIFHKGVKKQEQPKERLIPNKSRLLDWKENDRAVVTFKNKEEIENSLADLTDIVKEWITAAK